MNISGKIIGLPLDLESNILSRVPLKQLYSLKRVSKHWRDLISSQHFLQIHRQQHASRNSDGTILIVSLITTSVLSYDFRAAILTDLTSYTSKVPYFGIYRSLVGSCNGLLCFEDSHDFPLIIYNPLTGAYKKITRYVETCLDRIDFTSYPSNELHYIGSTRMVGHLTSMLLGFGYDCFSDDYKLLSIHKIWLNGAQTTRTLIEEGAYLYSFKANSWKVVNNKLIYRVFMEDKLTSDSEMVLTNNALHWLVDSSSQEECDHKFVIGSFDLRMEEYSEILAPVGLGIINAHRVTLSALDSCLHISHSTEDLSRMEVWVMKEYGVVQSWTKVFHCSLIDKLPNISGIPLPCAYSEDGQEIFIALKGSTETFVRCNLQRQEVSIVEFLSSDQEYLTILPWKGFLGSPIDD